MDVSLETNECVTSANIRVIGGSRPSIIGRDLMPNLELPIVQKTPEENVISVQGEQPGAEATEREDSLDPGRFISVSNLTTFLAESGKLRIIRYTRIFSKR